MERASQLPEERVFSFDDQPGLREQIHAVIRWILLFVTVLFFIWIGEGFLVDGGPAFIKNLREANPLGWWLLTALNLGRYAAVPFATVVFVLVAAARFVRDIYGLRSTGEGFRFVIAAMFAVPYPYVRVQKGRVSGGPVEPESIGKIGGPGGVVVEADSVVLFARTRTPSKTATSRGYFLAPFERIDCVVSLEDQEGCRDEIKTVTRDGIRVRLTDVRFRYRILPNDLDGKSHVRSLDRPYSYSEEALRRIAYEAPVSEDGEATWQQMVAKMLSRSIVGFINEHPVDFLTAPRRSGQDPRKELNELLYSQVQERLHRAGAQLLWIDVGHIDIVEDENAVDKNRVDRWAARWAGDAASKRAYADATLTAYKELGKAEAQAEMIMGLTQALQNLDLRATSKAQFTTMLLMRATQILEELTVNKGKEDQTR